jgi:hypothetical protein
MGDGGDGVVCVDHLGDIGHQEVDATLFPLAPLQTEPEPGVAEPVASGTVPQAAPPTPDRPSRPSVEAAVPTEAAANSPPRMHCTAVGAAAVLDAGSPDAAATRLEERCAVAVAATAAAAAPPCDAMDGHRDFGADLLELESGDEGRRLHAALTGMTDDAFDFAREVESGQRQFAEYQKVALVCVCVCVCPCCRVDAQRCVFRCRKPACSWRSIDGRTRSSERCSRPWVLLTSRWRSCRR